MTQPKEGISSHKKLMHYSVGAVIKRNNKYLLIDRANPPFGFAGLAGHIDEDETPEEALIREVKEESGLDVKRYDLLFEEELDWNWCSYGVKVHYWYLYKCEVYGSIKKSEEAKTINWYTQEQIKKLKLEPVWEYWFKKLGILNHKT